MLSRCMIGAIVSLAMSAMAPNGAFAQDAGEDRPHHFNDRPAGFNWKARRIKAARSISA